MVSIQVTATFDTNKCQIPCSSCFCPKDKLNKVEDSFPYRTEKGMMNIVQEMKTLLQNNMKSAAVEISKQYSVHPVEVSWG